MLYDQYAGKMRKYAAIKNKIILVIMGLLAIAAVIAILISGFLITKGMIFGNVKGETEYTYGDTLNFDAPFALFAKSRLQYSFDGAEWSEEIPVKAGNYFVRAESNRSFGFKGHSKAVAFTIKKKDLSITLAEDKAQWRETPAVNAAGLILGDVLESVDVKLSHDEIGPAEATIDAASAKIVSVDGLDVSGSYNVTALGGTIEIVAREITVGVDTLASSKTYDGKVIVPVHGILAGSVAEGHDIKVEFEATTQVGVGTESITIKSVSFFEGEKDVSGGYYVTLEDGEASISPRPITLKVDASSKVYDGTPLTVTEPYLANGATCAEGETYELEVFSDKLILVGVVDDYVRGVTVRNAEGEDTTDNYEITVENGLLEITLRPLTVITDNHNATYSGKPISDTRDPSTEGMAEGHELLVNSVASLTDASSTVNSVSYVIVNAEGEDVTNCHSFDEQFGTLTVDKCPIKLKVEVKNNGKEYDGKPLEITYVQTGGAVEGQAFYFEHRENVIEVSQSVDSYITGYGVKDIVTGENMDRNYDIVVEDSAVYVIPRKVNIWVTTPQNEGGRKKYDGTPMYVKVEDDHNVKGETLQIITVGDIVNVGDSVSAYILDKFVVYENEPERHVNMGNYDITVNDMALTVIPREITLTVNVKDNGKEYDGKPLDVTVEQSGDGVAEGEMLSVETRGDIINVSNSAGNYIKGTPAVYKTNGTPVDKENYIITVNDKAVTVVPRKITLTASAADNGKIYDAETLEVTVDGYQRVAEGEKLYWKPCHTIVDVKDAVEQNAYIASWYVKDIRGNTIDPKNYDVTCVNERLYISPRPVTITVIADENGKYYDGKKLIVTYEVEARSEDSGKLTGHSFSLSIPYDVSGGDYITPFYVDKYISGFTVRNSQGENVESSNYTPEYVGNTLEIKKRPLKIETGSAEKIYDGDAFDCQEHEKKLVDNVALEDQGVLSGERFEIAYDITKADKNAVNAGIYENSATVIILNEAGKNVADTCYEIEFVRGKIEIKKREMIITVGPVVKDYDGTPAEIKLEVGGVITDGRDVNCVIDDGVLVTKYGHTLTVTLNNPQNYVKPCVNKDFKVSYEIKGTDCNGEKGNKKGNYDVKVVYEDNVYVLADVITVNAHDLTVPYKSDFYTIGEFLVTEEDQINKIYMTHSLDPADYTVSLWFEMGDEYYHDAGEYRYKLVCRVTDVNGNDVTDELFNVMIEYDGGGDSAKLTIEKLKIEIDANDVEVVYNGAERNVWECITEKEVNLAHQEVHYVELDSSYRDVFRVNGSVNYYEYNIVVTVFEGEVNQTHNYDIVVNYRHEANESKQIKTDFSKLTINPLTVTIDARDIDKIYDGYAVTVDDCVPKGAQYTGELYGESVQISLSDVYINAISYGKYTVNWKIITDVVAPNYKPENNYDVTVNYEPDEQGNSKNYGVINIEKVNITVTVKDVVKPYDGKVWNNRLVGDAVTVVPEYTESQAVIDRELELYFDREYKNVNRDEQGAVIPYEYFVGFNLVNGSEDIDVNYNISYAYDHYRAVPTEDSDRLTVKGYSCITITPVEVRITLSDKVKTYDGTAFNAKKEGAYKIEFFSGKVANESLTVALDREYIDVNRDENGSVIPYEYTITVTVSSKNYEASLDNYEISIEDENGNSTDGASLTITPIEVDITIRDTSKYYDGKALDGEADGIISVPHEKAENIGEALEVVLDGEYIDVNRDENGNVIPYQYVVSITLTEGRDIGNYEFRLVDEEGNTKEYGLITILPVAVTVTAKNYTNVYDGTDFGERCNKFVTQKITAGAAVEDEILVVSLDRKYINVNLDEDGNVIPYEYFVTISVSGGRENLGNYEITYKYSNDGYSLLTINKRSATVTTPTAEKVYDGESFERYESDTVVENLAELDGFYIDSDSVVAVGPNVCVDVDNVYAIVITNSEGNDATANYDLTYVYGKLTIKKRTVTVETAAESKTYDGKILVNTSVQVSIDSENDLVPGHELVLVDGTQTEAYAGPNVWEHNNVQNVFEVMITDEEITKNYDIQYVYGILTIAPRDLNVSTESASKQYDGTALTKDGYIVGLPLTGHTVTEFNAKVTGQRTYIGISLNTIEDITFKVVDENGNDVTENYRPLVKEGELKVEGTTIGFTPYYVKKEYDAKPLYSDGGYMSLGTLADTDKLLCVMTSGSRTNAGTSESYVSLVIIKTEYGYLVYTATREEKDGVVKLYQNIFNAVRTDESAPMYIEYGDAWIAINTDDSASLYEGTVKNSNYTVENLVEMDGETIDLGEVHCYSFENTTGTICVTKRKVVITCDSVTEEYEDGKTIIGSCRITYGSMAEGHYIDAYSTCKATEKGEPVTNTVKMENIGIYADSKKNEDITSEVFDNYEFVIEDGTLLLT